MAGDCEGRDNPTSTGVEGGNGVSGLLEGYELAAKVNMLGVGTG